MNDYTTYVAMDTHKKQHAIAVLDTRTGEIRQFLVKNTAKDVAKMVKGIARQAPAKIKFCYEAGVCGFTLQRRIEAMGHQCSVIAPSLVPLKPGDRIKTDRRDAKKLLSLFAAGQLTEVYPPSPEQEAARELTRARNSAAENLKRIRHQLLKFLTRHGYIYHAGRHWTQKHFQWMRALEFDLPDLREVFEIYYVELQHCLQRLASLDKRLEELARRPEYRKIVALLCCFKGIDTLTAITLIAEIFEFGRFDSPKALMAYLGLTPAQYSSGEHHQSGPITKTGNSRVRRLLVESAWHYRHRPSVSKQLHLRRKGQPQWAIDIADRAMLRLHQRYRRLIHAGKLPNKAVIAVARELAGFIWAMMRPGQLHGNGRACSRPPATTQVRIA
jgi:transposase